MTTSGDRDVPKSLLVVSHINHFEHDGRLWSYGPYAREIDRWAQLFEEVRIASPWRREPPDGDAVAFRAPNLVPSPLTETGGTTLAAKLHQLAHVPGLLLSLTRVMRAADAVHVRCPGNIGLLAAFLAPLCARYRVAKYAGRWSSRPGDRWLIRLQRGLLRYWFRGPVTIYGDARNEPEHVVPFFTAMMTQSQIVRALSATQTKRGFHDPVRLLYSGRLFEGKGLLELIEACGVLARDDRRFVLHLLGDGELRSAVEDRIADLDLEGHIELLGAREYEDTFEHYRWADCLVLPSESEGWPKVLTEAMVHHCLCISTVGGHVAKMLDGRGIVIEAVTPESIKDAISEALDNEERADQLRAKAAEWAAGFSLQGLRDALAELLSERWQVDIEVTSTKADEGGTTSGAQQSG